MFSFIFYLCFVLQPILYYNSVFGRRESLKRYILEKGAKPAIFGSYSYDPVRQVFVPPPRESSATAEQSTNPYRETEAHGEATTDETNRLDNHDDGNQKHDDNKNQQDSSTTPEFGGSSTIGITAHSDLSRKGAGQK